MRRSFNLPVHSGPRDMIPFMEHLIERTKQELRLRRANYKDLIRRIYEAEIGIARAESLRQKLFKKVRVAGQREVFDHTALWVRFYCSTSLCAGSSGGVRVVLEAVLSAEGAGFVHR